MRTDLIAAAAAHALGTAYARIERAATTPYCPLAGAHAPVGALKRNAGASILDIRDELVAQFKAGPSFTKFEVEQDAGAPFAGVLGDLIYAETMLVEASIACRMLEEAGAPRSWAFRLDEGILGSVRISIASIRSQIKMLSAPKVEEDPFAVFELV